ncbi:MAG TPA: aspartate aminotransferase family protein [Bryobacteraceae bacterium]|nr:aspartate aminotransferase family protein [Bryobacteraceae bacterium]
MYLFQNYARYPLALKRGKGTWLYDISGKRYLDLISGIGVNALGHAHPRITRVIREQAALLIHSSNLYYHEFQGPLAQKLAETSGLDRAFFCNSGTEAMEAAIKILHAHGRRQDPAKYEIIALDNSFHGRTIGALALTGQPKYRADFEPLMPGVKHIPMGDAAALETAFSQRTAGMVIETIQGEGGICPAPAEYLRQARDLADRYNALLVFDEIQCGIGRPCVHFAYQLHQPAILPDVVAMAKPIACGLPLGAVIANEKAASAIGPGMHGTTFGGGALSCRVALEFYQILDEIMPQMRLVSAQLFDGLNELKRKHTTIKDVRGAGLMIGVETEYPCKHFVQMGMEQGLLFNVTHDNVVRLLPPYILSEKEAGKALKGLARIFRKARPAA